MALSEKEINKQIVATVEGIVGDLSPDATEAEAHQFISDSLEIVSGIKATLEEVLSKHTSHTVH
tara:strand:+ start:4194 stop:4385 length:192 start_codon:yes stop_codon:yes gene_type:complete